MSQLEIKQEKWLAANEILPEVWSTMQNSIYPGANPASIKLAIDYCKARNLDPLKKPVHIVPMYVKDSKTGQGSMRDVIMPGIYELRITASRTQEFAGIDEPTFGPNIEYLGVTAPESCTVTVYRMIAGQRVAFSHTEFFDECAVVVKKTGKINDMWTRRKRGQLSKCAEAGALRKAFPEEFGGIMTAEEMKDESNFIDQAKTVSRPKASVSDFQAKLLEQEPIEQNQTIEDEGQ